MTPSGGRNPRHRPAPVRRPSPTVVAAVAKASASPDETRRRQLAAHPICQWQARMIRCVAEATDAVVSREGVLRSSCAGHVGAWTRTGGRLV
jgi:hypothetical protein